MPLLSILRFVSTLVSLAVLAAAGWLIWSGLEGATVIDETGQVRRTSGTWLLWAGLALLAWSFLGRFVVRLLLARPDSDPTHPLRAPGRLIVSPTGSSLFVETLGPADAPTIVLSHGWGLDSTIWYYAKRALGERWRVVTWDLAGLGRSKAARGAVSLEAFATDLRSVVEAAAPSGQVVLVGHSIGGMTIQTLARDHPDFFRDRIGGVILVHTTHTNPLCTTVFSPILRALQKPVLEPSMYLTVALQPLMWLAAWQSWMSGGTHWAMRFGFGRFVARSQLDQTALLATRNPPGVQARGNLSMFRWDATGALPHIGKPTLILAGDLDIVTKVEASETMAGLVPGGALEIVEGVNHMGFLERPELYDNLIASFVERCQPTRAPAP
jgi:pimeloyl-ACP methyl ester carboxylesterase